MRILTCCVLVSLACLAGGASFDVRTFGAAGDGVSKDTAAVQRAIDACAEKGGRVVVPPGTYLIGSIWLKDGVELHLQEGATLLGSPDLADYNSPDAYPQNFGSVKEGWSAKHLILAIEKRNVSITGRGTIDGNGRAFFSGKVSPGGKVCWRQGSIGARGKRAEQRRPGQEIVFIECEGVTVRDVTFRDMSCWSCFFHGCADVTVGGVTVRNGILNINTDGFDIDSCRNVCIGDCDIVTGDDAIAIRGSPARLKNPAKVCENIEVSNIVCRVSADGVRVGVGHGTIRHVRVSDMKILGAGRGLHVQCCYGRPKKDGKVGVDISDVTFERISIKDVCEAVCVAAGAPVSTATLCDIFFKDVTAESFSGTVVAGNGTTRPENVVFENCGFRIAASSDAPVKDSECGVLDGCAIGAFRIEKTGRVSFRNCSLTWDDGVAPGFKRAFSLHDAPAPEIDAQCVGLSIQGRTVTSLSGGGWTADGKKPDEEKYARRPAEIVRAGRTADEHEPVVSFRDVATWRVETSNAVAKAEYATDRVLFGDGACKITYRGTGDEKHPWATFLFPKPVDVPADADTMSIWIWGNNLNGFWRDDTPFVVVRALFEKKNGKRVSYELGHVLSPRWSKYYSRFNRWLKSELEPPAKLVGVMVYNGHNKEDRFIYLDSFCLYREELKPLSFKPCAKRGVQLFADAPQGLNTGEGRLPFPNTPRTVLPPEKTPDASIEYRVPEKPADWDSLAFRCKGGEWIPLAKGGGIFPKSARDAEIKFFRDGDSLVCDIVRKEPGVEEVRFGAIAAPDAVAVPIPFWNYREKGWNNRPSVVTVKSGGKALFVSATPDWTQSNASELFAGRSSPGLAAANGGVRYKRKTDGKRNGCFERFVWTVSHDFGSTLPSIPNPPAKWKSVTGTHLWHAQTFPKVANSREFWWGVKRFGMKNIVAHEFGMFWSDHRDTVFRWGEGESFQPLYAAVDKGGDDGFRKHLQYFKDLGFRFSMYNDFVDLRPTCRYWSTDNVVRKEDGTLLKSWPGSYSSKPVWAVGTCEKLAPQLKEKFGFDCGYCDVQTCVTPWSRTDYDARVPGAGTFAQTYYAYGEVLLLERKAWNGPLYSEGSTHWMYAGLCDGNYGQDEEYDLPRNPWLVDFDLTRIHPLSCDFGMGHNLDMFYMHRKYDEIPSNQMTDRFIAATAAFGHPGYLIVNWINSSRSYFLLQSLAARYTQVTAKSICYADAKGVLHPTSEAVANGTYVRSQVAVTYDDGTVVVANGSTNEQMSVEIAGRRIVLPPNGFWGRSGDGKAESFMGEIDGHRAEWAYGDGYKYAYGRGTFTRFPGGTGVDGIVIRLDEGNGVEEVIPVRATKPQRIELPYAVSSVSPLDYRGNVIRGQCDFEVKDGRTLLPTQSSKAFSWRVTRKAE